MRGPVQAMLRVLAACLRSQFICRFIHYSRRRRTSIPWSTKAQCERLVFTPWHSLAAHQPIGSINRLRKAVYEASAQHRLRQPEDAAGQ